MKQNVFFKKVGQYNLIREIGSGSFARVYRARSDNSNDDVAVKMISKQALRQENYAIIEKEIDILMKFDHPNIIKLLDYKRTANHYYLIFEFCEYGDLDNYIRKNSDQGRLPELEVKRIVQQLASALEKMHLLRIVHRDLKLANILVNKSFQIKLADFGFAKYNDENQFLISYCGTPLTMAPEVLKREKYTEKCDIWSVGVMIFQMLYGVAPFLPPKGGNINDLINVIATSELKFPDSPPVSDSLKKLLMSMLQKDWRNRAQFFEFFQNKWLKDEEHIEKPSPYLQSILRQSTKLSPQVSPKNQNDSGQNQVSKHKLSEDVEQDQLLMDKEVIITESQTEPYLKFLSFGISNEIKSYLVAYMKNLQSLDDLCRQIQLENNRLGTEELTNLIIAIRVLKGQRLEQGFRFLKEQVVILQNSSSMSELVSLQMYLPLKGIQEQMSTQLMELQTEFFKQEAVLTKFINTRYTVADNVYSCMLDFLTVLLREEKLNTVSKKLFEDIFELLKQLVNYPPDDSSLFCRIVLNSSDMKKYYEIFKLVKTYHQEIFTYTESITQSEVTDQSLKFTCQAIPDDQSEKYVSFTLSDVSQLQNVLIEQMKNQGIVIVS